VRKSKAFLRAGSLSAMAAGLALTVAACSSGDAPATATKSAGASAAKKTAAKPRDEGLSEMVAAVSSAKAGPPVEMKFELRSRPEVGQVTIIDIALVPRAPIPDSVSASFQVGDGVEIVEGSQLARLDKLTDGAPIRHVVKILPKRDGIFALRAVVSFAVANQDWSRTFSIPVIAGEGLQEQVAKGP